MATRGMLVTTLLAALGACSPFGGNAFSCSEDTQCGNGKCTSGFCAFADPSCSSGFKFSDSSGSLSNTCVGDGSNATDAAVDTFVDPSAKCFGTGFGKVCFAPADVPSATLQITTAISTDGPMCSTKVVGAPPWCVIAATDLTVSGGPIAVTGSKPLVLVATTGTLLIAATLDVASHITPAQAGAGHDLATTCDAGTPPTGDGGGAGGSFGAVGAKGGNGNGGNTGGVNGAAAVSTAAMRGGCQGQPGSGTNPGAGGLGGGAIYLIATTAIDVTGSIDASGAAGAHGKASKGGGGGGGAGGLIGLDSIVVTSSGAIFANGGGGGEGASGGADGHDGTESSNGGVATGGTGGTANGGDGGDGGATGSAPVTGEPENSDGGGGGGGSVGAIRLYQAQAISGGTVSPPPTL